ncbi:hypothetical protein [Holospora curviuscula]|uniref:Uncharacterized protein n=1 Tax=Holospora curviuscula TaxID=1082868 RepID=A0A2S5RHW3_9PROT|nr:hypothetical protein [Holospora curviuscula]PPE06893.1 hypothetical protein HCUR_00107 [Holospora curviuscula]
MEFLEYTNIKLINTEFYYPGLRGIFPQINTALKIVKLRLDGCNGGAIFRGIYEVTKRSIEKFGLRS